METDDEKWDNDLEEKLTKIGYRLLQNDKVPWVIVADYVDECRIQFNLTEKQTKELLLSLLKF